MRKTPESVKAAQIKYVETVQQWKAECAKKVALLAEIKAKKDASTTAEHKEEIKNLRKFQKELNNFLHFSCDSGYSNPHLMTTAKESHLVSL